MITLDAALIKRSRGALLVDFYADWCSPCKAIAPTLRRLETKYDDVVFGKLDIDAHPDVADQFKVKSIPTLLLLRKGQEVGRVVGAVAESKIRVLLDRA